MSESDLAEKVSWTPLLEKYFSETAERAGCLSWLHQKSEGYYSKTKKWIELPAIVLSSVIGFGSVGSSSMFENDTKLASIILGVMSLFVSVLQTTGSYFGWSKRAENHRLSAIHYSKLQRFISIEMKLPQAERMEPTAFLKMVKGEYDRLQEVSPLIPSHIVEEFKSKFNNENYKDISKPPECNGLEHVVVFEETPSLVIRSPIHTPRIEAPIHPLTQEQEKKQ